MRAACPILAVIALPLALAGCGEGDYPSLARRPAEAIAANPPVTAASPAAPAAPLDPALAARLDALAERVRAAHARFTTHRVGARARIAAASHAAVGSDAWENANVALAELEAARASLGLALAEIDGLYNDDRVANALADADAGSSGARANGAALTAARDSAQGLADADDAELNALKAMLPE